MSESRPVRIGVYVCHCGSNIGGSVDVLDLVAYAAGLPNVAVAREHRYACSPAGQETIKQDIRELGLDRVVVAACSPRMHETTFRAVLQEAGLNPYLLAVANIREHCSWITRDKDAGTDKAKRLVSGAVRRVVWQEPLEERQVPVRPVSLVVGGGIAGIQAALSIANAGYRVYLVEKETSIGGHMAQLDKTFPTLDCSACLLNPRMVQVAHHPNITLLTYSQVTAVSGYVGNFQVQVKRQPRYVDLSKCTGCGECVPVCPVSLPSEFDQYLGLRKAIYRLFPQAVPAAFAIDKRGVPPCRAACPAGVNVQGSLSLIRQGKYQEALALVKRDLPFPAICGRVCNHPCETACTRDKMESPLSIAALERFVADWEAKEGGGGREDRGDVRQSAIGNRKSPIAVVGSGPAGLTCAYQLARRGYAVKVLEALPVAGGMMAVGIPEYRLPRDVLHREIAEIERLGVEVVLNTALGRDFQLDDLFAQGFQAVFLALGAHKGQRMNIPGEEKAGVLHGTDFLRDLALHAASVPRPPSPVLGKRVVVIGGGHTAVDAARCALRLGAKSVTLAYRRSRSEMRVDPGEIDQAEEEGVRVESLAVPLRILGDTAVTGLACLRMAPGEPDDSARGQPIPVRGADFTLPCDTLIVAIGQAAEVSPESGLDLTGQGAIAADPETCATDWPGVFAGGDAVAGPATVIEAVAAGNRAAESIHRYLTGQDLREGRVFATPPERIAHKIVTNERPVPRVQMPVLPPEERTVSFREVELGLDEAAVRREAKRCLDCAVCSECLECVKACGPRAIDQAMPEETLKLEVGTIVLATGHKFFDPARLPQFGYGQLPNVIDSMEFERMCNSSGPTGGEIITADGNIPGSVAFVHCVGCRDANAHPYCSRLCCMHAMKQAHLVREKTGAEVYELYVDIRAGGKGYEEFYQQVQNEGVTFIRGRGVAVTPSEDGKLTVHCQDAGQGQTMTLDVDLVVLVTGMEPHQDADAVAQTFHITRDKDGFFLEAHPKLQPFQTNTDGIFLAGTCQGPKDIPDTVAHANAAAAEALSLMGRGIVTVEPTMAEIEADLCSGCFICNNLCAYTAISFDPLRRISVVNEALCKGCGVCVAACPAGAAQARHFSDEQIFAEIEGVLA